MRSLFNSAMVILLITVFFGCKEQQTVEINTPAESKQVVEEVPDIADVEFSDGLIGKIWHNYLQMKMALALSDAGQVQQTADSMVETFDDQLEVLKSLALKISETDDIEVQRELFAQFTEEIGPLFQNALSGGTIYKKHCPMAFDNKGAFWYADIEEISNPYFGEKMPRCGSIVETISK